MKQVVVVFDGPPGAESGRFVEAETMDGASVRAGEWVQRPGDGLWTLGPLVSVAELHEALNALVETSPADGWDPYEYGEWNGYGARGDVDFVDDVDESNSGDVHSHGYAQGRWELAKKLRALLDGLV